MASVILTATCGLRATGQSRVPRYGSALLVSNHLSYMDVFVLGIPLARPLNYVARSTLFFPGLGAFIRSVGAFPIQRDGMGASGLKETLRRLKYNGIVVLFPEGTRSEDGRMGELKSGIAVLALKAKVPVIPAGIVGTFEAWPKGQLFPRPHPIWIEYGEPIYPADFAGMSHPEMTALIHERIRRCQEGAERAMARANGRGGEGLEASEHSG